MSADILRILHVAPAYYPATYWGGPTFSVYALNNALAALQDVSLKVLTTDTAGPRLADRLDRTNLAGLYQNQEVHITRRIMGRDVSVEFLFRMLELVRWADVVHLTSTYSFSTIPTLILCRLYDKPLVWSPRGAIQDAYEWEGTPNKRLKRIWENLCNTLIRRGKVVTHTTSERERLATQARISKATARIIPNGVDVLEPLPIRDWLPGGRLRLMYLGRLAPKKGIDNLLKTVRQLDDPKIFLTIYGTGDDVYAESLKSLAAELGFLSGRVLFAGHVEGIDKSVALHKADICIVPSHTENFCMVVAEALAHGVPVIASHGTPWAGVEDKQCGLWVDNSPESLAQAIVQMRNMPLQEMGQRGWHWMKNDFSWESVANEMVAVYRSLIF